MATLNVSGGGTVLDKAYEDLGVHFSTRFTWCYERLKPELNRLYEKAKREQWNASTNLDWSIDVDPEHLGGPIEEAQMSGIPAWDKLTPKERATVLHHQAAWTSSQFLHGEQAALLVSSKLVQTVPWLDAKLFGASQVMDEARHVEVFHRYLTEKMDLAYPITPGLKELAGRILTEDRWDMNFLGMQVLVEGLALAAFGFMWQVTTEPLMKSLVKFVMADEARHVAFGVISLRDLYGQLTDAERRDREDFAVDACAMLRERLVGQGEVAERLGLPVKAVREATRDDPGARAFNSLLFTRLMPNLKKLGLVNQRTIPRYETLGVMRFVDAARPSDETWHEEVVAPEDYAPEG